MSLSRLSRSLLGRLPRSAPIPTMTWLNKINPTPTFPAYTGPYKVGSVDVELPTSQLESPGRSDSPSTNLATVSFRVFYPARPESKQKGTRWIQSPQKDVVSAYAKFLGAGNAMAGLFAYVRSMDIPGIVADFGIEHFHNCCTMLPFPFTQMPMCSNHLPKRNDGP